MKWFVLICCACGPGTTATQPNTMTPGIGSADTGDAFVFSSTLTVPLRFDVAQGETKTYDVSVDRLSTFSELEVSMLLLDEPTGVSATGSISSGQLTGGLYLEAQAAAVVGEHACRLRLTGGNTTVIVAVVLTVVPAGMKLGISFDAPPAAIDFDQDGSDSAMISFLRTPTATGMVSFAVLGLPAGVDAAFEPSLVPGTATMLTLTDDGTAAPGDTVLTIVASIAGHAPASVPLTLTVAPRQTLNITVHSGHGPIAGAQVLVDGVSSPASDAVGRTTLVRQVPRGSSYTLVTLGSASSQVRAVSIYQGLHQANPVVYLPSLPSIQTESFGIATKTVNPVGALLYVGSEAIATSTKSHMAYGTIRAADGARLSTRDFGPKLYSDGAIGPTPVWPTDLRPPFGSNNGPILHSSLSVPEGSTGFHADLSMVVIEYQARNGGVAAGTHAAGWKPKNYLLFGRCRLANIPDATFGNLEIASTTSLDRAQRCQTRLEDGIFLETVAGAQATVTPTFTLPPGHVFYEKRLVLHSNMDGWELPIVADCFDPTDSDCDDQLLAEHTDINFIVPSGGTPPGYQSLTPYGRLRVRNGTNASDAYFAASGSPHLAPPVAPELLAPPAAGTFGYDSPLSLSRGGYTPGLSTFRMTCIGSLPYYYLSCFTDTDTCTLPSWMSPFPLASLPAGTCQLQGFVGQPLATVDDLAASAANYEAMSTVVTSGVRYSGETGPRAVTAAP